MAKGNIDWDNRLSWASTAFFIGSVTNATIKTVLPIPESLWGLLSTLVGVVIICVYANCFSELLRRSSKIFWRFIAIFCFVYIISAILILFRGELLTQMVKGTALLTFAWWIPTGSFACSVNNKKVLYQVWVKASYIISALSILLFFFHLPQEDSSGTEYNMTFGFYIILPLLIQINEFSKNKRLWLLTLILFEIFTVFVYASRGVLLSLFFYIVYKYAFESNSVARKVLSFIVLSLIVFLLVSSTEALVKYAVSVLDVLGYESRTLEMIATDSAFSSSGRDEIWEICFNMIKQHPFLGWGLGGEYIEIAKKLHGIPASEVLAISYNPHNGLIQNLVCFGILWGIIVDFYMLLPIIRIKKIKNLYTYDLVLIFFSAAVVPISISSAGYFTNPSVAMCLFLFYYRNHQSYRI